MDYEKRSEIRETARCAWREGATIKEVARILDVSVPRAGQVVERFRREKRNHDISAAQQRRYAAFLCLSDNGFSLDEIALFFDLDKGVAERIKSEAEVDAGRAEPHFAHTLELSVRALNALERAGASSLKDVCNISEAELLSAKGCGKLTVAEIKEELDRNGLSLRP